MHLMVNFKPWKGGRRECVCCGGPTSTSLSLHLVPLVNQNRGDNRTNTWANSKRDRVEITRIIAEICALVFFGNIKKARMWAEKKVLPREWPSMDGPSHSRPPSPSPSLLLFATLVPNRLSLSLLPRPRNQRRGGWRIHPQHCQGKQQLYWYHR